MQCPICGSAEFGDFRTRRLVRCAGCGSFERSRLLWLILGDLPLSKSPLPFMHFAPEIGIARALADRLGNRYKAFDFQPEVYTKAGIDARSFDLCTDTQTLAEGSVGAICHVHVLEHVRCNSAFVLSNLNASLAPGGYHIFGVPFYSRHFRENLSPELTNEDRVNQFGHEDHVRSFGTQDFETMFGGAFEGMQRLDLGVHIDTDALARANVPARAIGSLSAHSILVYQKLPVS